MKADLLDVNVGRIAPIVLFVYQRPDHTRKTLEALKANDGSSEAELYVYCDGPRDGANEQELEKIQEVRSLIASDSWCGQVHIIENKKNNGIVAAIRDGITEMLNRFDRVIVIEDDIVTSPGFLRFMTDALARFEDDERVMHIGGYVPETWGLRPYKPFFSRYMSCWGWGTWRRAWDKGSWNESELYATITADHQVLRHYNLDGCISVEKQLEGAIDGSILTWDAQWFTSIYLEGGLCFYPRRSLVRNIGLDGTGVNYSYSQELILANEYVSVLMDREVVPDIRIRESSLGRYYLKKFYRFGKRANLTREVYFLGKNAIDLILGKSFLGKYSSHEGRNR